MDNYRFTSRRGFGILSPPNQTSPFAFILRMCPSVLEMETLMDELSFLLHSTLEHCSSLGLKANPSSLPLIWNLISLAPTSMCAFVVLRKGLPRIRGIFMSSCMSSTTKSTGTMNFHIFTRIFSVIPVG